MPRRLGQDYQWAPGRPNRAGIFKFQLPLVQAQRRGGARMTEKVLEVGYMPAVTVDDLTTLARLPEPGLGDQPRPVWQVSTAPHGYEGEGFPVRRAFAGIDLGLLDPFIMM